MAPPTSAPPTEAQSIALAIDGGHVKAVRSYQMRSFEVFVAQVSNDNGPPVVFSSMPAEADRQAQQLRGVLHDLGATPGTPVTTHGPSHSTPRFWTVSERIAGHKLPKSVDFVDALPRTAAGKVLRPRSGTCWRARKASRGRWTLRGWLSDAILAMGVKV